MSGAAIVNGGGLTNTGGPGGIGLHTSISGTQCLAIWGFPPSWLWAHIRDWVVAHETILHYSRAVRRIVRTDELGVPVFWLKFRTAHGARMFYSGVRNPGPITAEGPGIHCNYVRNQDYAGANGRSQDFWDVHSGYSQNQNPLDPFSTSLCRGSVTSRELWSLLGLPVSNYDPNLVRITSKKLRRLKKNHSSTESPTESH